MSVFQSVQLNDSSNFMVVLRNLLSHLFVISALCLASRAQCSVLMQSAELFFVCKLGDFRRFSVLRLHNIMTQYIMT